MTLVRARAILIIEYLRLLIFVVAEVYLGILWACMYSCHLVREARERSYHAHFRWGHINTSPLISSVLKVVHTAMSRKVVGKSARDNPVSYCGWFLVHCSSKKFERMARKAMDLFLWVLKESNKSKVRWLQCQEHSIDHIPCYVSGLSRAHFFRQPFLK